MEQVTTNREFLGHVAVDSGQLLLTDPCYLKQWKGHEYKVAHSRYKDIETGKFWQDRENFSAYDALISECGATPNELIATGRWREEPLPEPSGEYSYTGCCEMTLSPKCSGQLKFEGGHAGAGVAFSSGYGDGVYPVFAERDGTGRIVRVTVEMD